MCVCVRVCVIGQYVCAGWWCKIMRARVCVCVCGAFNCLCGCVHGWLVSVVGVCVGGWYICVCMCVDVIIDGVCVTVMGKCLCVDGQCACGVSVFMCV